MKLATARLPISEHIDMSTRHVLTVNHVYEILLQQHNVGDWKTALEIVIPARKGAQIKSSNTCIAHEDGSAEDGSAEDGSAEDESES